MLSPTLLVPLWLAVAPADVLADPRPASSRITAVTVYGSGQAEVTREVNIPEGAGTMELVVAPLPSATMANSLFAEGPEGIRVLSIRYRTRPVPRGDVPEREARVRQLTQEGEILQSQITVQGEDQRLLREITDYAGRTTRNLAESGRFEDIGMINLVRFVMTTRAASAQTDTELRQRLQGVNEAADAARRELAQVKEGQPVVERDALLMVQKTRPEPTTIRLGYLVVAAKWAPQYRVRSAADDAPVRLEYLAAVSQQTGEPWTGVALTLSTARPTLDAAPPDLLPLRMTVTGAEDASTRSRAVDTHDDRSERIRAELNRAIPLRFPQDTSLGEVVKYLRQSTTGVAFPNGIPIYIDPQGLQDVDRTEDSPIRLDLVDLPLRTTLPLLLRQLNLTYVVQDGLLTITRPPEPSDSDLVMGGGMGGMGGGMGGMGGMGGAIDQAQAAGAMLNRSAAGGQASELRVGDEPTLPRGGAIPEFDPAAASVTLSVAGPVDIPTRDDPLLVEVGRADLRADFFAQATPVLTPRVYRLARLTNSSPFVVLPGDATVYSGTEFVGRMTLPLVAAGEAFVVGFGVDPQLQVSRRLVTKTRTVQGGNQVFTYAFRLNLRNYRDRAVRVQLQDRLPLPEGEAIAVHLGKTSRELSQDVLYQRTGRADNLLRWDLDLPAKTVGDQPLSVEYDFRVEYARDLPPPRFQAGSLKENPIGGPASQRGMGGFQSVTPPAEPRDASKP